MTDLVPTPGQYPWGEDLNAALERVYEAADEAVTGVAVATVAGPQWGATVDVVNGVATFTFTVPPGGTALVRGVLPNGSDMNLIREPGYYIIPTAAAAGTMLNWPTGRAGTLLVGKDPGAAMTTHDAIAYVSATAPVERYSRATISTLPTGWSLWDTAGWVKGLLNGSAAARVNVDTHRASGAWLITSRTYVDGLPGTGTGMLEVWAHPSTGVAYQRFTEALADDSLFVYLRRSRIVAGWAGISWSPQTAQVATGSSSSLEVQVSDHAARVEQARGRRGGGIGTAGRAVVMLRFDHWALAFRDKVLPILREFALPGTLNLNYDNIGIAQNGGGAITWAIVQDWNQYDGIEIANHGATHTNAGTRAAIYHEIVDGRRLLEAAMPRVAVETWHEHGSAYLTAADIPGDIGLNLGREPRNFLESYAGRLVLAEHAVVEGKSGGFYVPLSGSPQLGQSHMSIDQDTAAEAIALVDIAQQLTRGVTLYVHPGLLDTVLVGSSAWPVTYNGDGSVVVTDPSTATTQTFASEAAYQAWATAGGHTIYMRTAYFRELCAHLAAERAAGRLMVCTSAGGAFADRSHDRRESLFLNPGFLDAGASWSATGWTITNPGPDVQLQASSSAGPISQITLLHSRFGAAMGATHELLIRASSAVPTNLLMRMEQVGNAANWQVERTYAVPGDGQPRDYRLLLTLPRDATISQMRTLFGGPSVKIDGEPLLAAI